MCLSKGNQLRGSALGNRIQREQALKSYYKDPAICKHCGKVIEVGEGQRPSQAKIKKFCNSSCSASFNNKVKPKRVLKKRISKICACGEGIPKYLTVDGKLRDLRGRTKCLECMPLYSSLSKKREQKECENLGCSVLHTNKKFCSSKCYGQSAKKIRIRSGFLPLPLNQVLVEDSTYGRGKLKERLLYKGLLKNQCYECGQLPEWQGKKLVLVIDHINGVNNDHRLGNLRILCPNCNSQTNTFAGRNAKRGKKLYFCSLCNGHIPKQSITGLCKPCYIDSKRRIR